MWRFESFNEENIGGYPGTILRYSRPVRRIISAAENWAYHIGLLDISKLCLPHFLGLGAPQAGSTWLHKNLSAHPEIFLPPEKELHYFDRNFHKRLKSYSLTFKSAGNCKRGEITPGYSALSRQQIRLIRKLMPDLRLVYILRNPVDQRLSVARRVLSRRSGDPFNELPDSEVFEFLESAPKKPGNYAEGIERHNYPDILKNWWSFFPRDQLYLGFFEEIKNDPHSLLKRVFNHIGVSADLDRVQFPAFQKVNPNPQVPIPEKFIVFLQELYRDSIEELFEMLGDPVSSWRIDST